MNKELATGLIIMTVIAGIILHDAIIKYLAAKRENKRFKQKYLEHYKLANDSTKV